MEKEHRFVGGYCAECGASTKNIDPICPGPLMTIVPREVKHTALVIGWMGTKTVYIDVPKEKAIERWCADNDETPEGFLENGLDTLIREFEFTDSFGVYDAWKE